MVWYSHLFQNVPQLIVIHTVKGFGLINEAEIVVFLELSCFFDDPADHLYSLVAFMELMLMVVISGPVLNLVPLTVWINPHRSSVDHGSFVIGITLS